MNSAASEDKQGSPGENQRKDAAGVRSVSVIDNRIDSRDLFIATREIIIGHGEDRYRLRLTAQNKLILTK